MILTKSCSRLTFLLVLCLGSALPEDKRSDDLTQEVISSMSRVLDFFKRDFRSINLDGIFGLRVAQGAFLSIINNVKDGKLNVEDNVLRQVKGLHNKASAVAQDALPFLELSAPEYYKKFKKQVSYPWPNFKPFTSKKLSEQHYEPQKRQNVINFNEETSDQCMSELTGTASESDSGQPCHISDKCWGLFSAEGTQGYALTHQALFFQLGEIQGCTPVLLKRLEQSNIKGGLQEVYNRICSNIYPEMTAIEQKRTLDQSSYHRDLYMEQAMVCGSMGYGQFLSNQRLRKILSWQRNDGCFGEGRDAYQDDNDDETEQFSETDADDMGAQQSELIDKSDKDGTDKRNINSPFGNIKKSLEYEYSQILRKPLGMRTMRSLLIEKELQDGCLSHVTGVASGLLGVYLRWLLYSHGQQFQKHEESETNKSLQSKEIKVFVNDDLVDALALKENQLKYQQKMEQDQMPRSNDQSAHLIQMRRAAMLEKHGVFIKKNVEGGEGEGSTAWRVIIFGGVFLALMLILVKGVRKMPNLLLFSRMRKNTHVI